jgi:hypothetical protein
MLEPMKELKNPVNMVDSLINKVAKMNRIQYTMKDKNFIKSLND